MNPYRLASPRDDYTEFDRALAEREFLEQRYESYMREVRRARNAALRFAASRLSSTMASSIRVRW